MTLQMLRSNCALQAFLYRPRRRCHALNDEKKRVREGDERLSELKRKPSGSAHDRVARSSSSDAAKKGKTKKGGDVSHALRTVYDSTLHEEIPADFLDLLGKLD